MTLVVDNIGLLVTADEALGEGPLGLLRDAAVVIEDGLVAAVERAGAAADERIDAEGRCVIPGFVDSHTHLVFAGDRGDEFAAHPGLDVARQRAVGLRGDDREALGERDALRERCGGERAQQRTHGVETIGG